MRVEPVPGDRNLAIYRESGFTGAFHLGERPALVVVDLIRGFTDPRAPLGSEMGEVVERTHELLVTARAKSVLTIFTTIAFDEAARVRSAWIRKVPSLAEFMVRAKSTEIDPRLDRKEDELIISKRGASAFFETSLHTLLAARRTDTVIIVGATTSGCVRASVVDSVQHGYDTFVVTDCVADRAAGPHSANLFDMTMKYADGITAVDVISYFGTYSPGASSTQPEGAQS